MTSPAAIARAKHRWIAISYRRTGKPTSMSALRCAEINRLFDARYGAVLPDDDAGKDDVRIMVHHLALMSGDQRRRITSWIAQRASWMRPDEMEKLVEQAIAKPLRWRADKLAARLNLTQSLRTQLGIKTIGAVDVTKEQRAAARKARKREDMRRRRRATGAKPRSQYEAAATEKGKPWEAEGISRRTWYRRRQRSS